MIGAILIGLGVFILLGVLNVIPVTFWSFVLWAITIWMGYSSISSMVKRGFPKGLTMLGLAILLALSLIGIIHISFWQFILSAAGLGLIQAGLSYFLEERQIRIFRGYWE